MSKISSVREPLAFFVQLNPKKASRMISAIGGGSTRITIIVGPPPGHFRRTYHPGLDRSTNAFWSEEQEASAPSTSLCKHWSPRTANWQRHWQQHAKYRFNFPFPSVRTHLSETRARTLPLTLLLSRSAPSERKTRGTVTSISRLTTRS